MTRVLLITPYGFQNQGVRLLSAILQREGFEAPVLFMKRWMNNNVRPPSDHELSLLDGFVADTRPDVIGFGFGTPYLKMIRAWTRRLRAVSDAHVLWGGVHPTISPEDCTDHADSVCVGEGEFPTLDLARAIEAGSPPDAIANLRVRADGDVRRNPLRPLIQDLDTLPYGQLFDVPCFSIEDGRLRRGDPLGDSAIYRVFASRGCPFHCAFCYNNQYRRIYEGLGRYHRARSVASVVAELEIARRRLTTLRRVKFDDDSFVFPAAWIEEFADAYPRRVGLPFDVLMNPEVFREDAFRKLVRAGLVAMQVGVQSASRDEVEGDYRRKDSGAKVREMARVARELGVEVFYDVILDNPLARRADKQAMFDFLLDLPRPFHLFLYSLTVFPKSEIASKLVDAGRITVDEIEGNATKSFRQFRLSLDYPRPAEDTFYASVISLTSKGFVPRALIRLLARSDRLRRRPAPLRRFAEFANLIKLVQVGYRMWRRGELSGFKLREYANLRRLLNL